MVDSAERIAISAHLSLDLVTKALEALRDEGRAVQEGTSWRASGPPSEQSP